MERYIYVCTTYVHSKRVANVTNVWRELSVSIALITSDEILHKNAITIKIWRPKKFCFDKYFKII